jgi:predicted DNA-binding transcriptional regulator AlpA
MTAKPALGKRDDADLVGTADIARRLGVTRQRVGQLRQRGDFPAPVARLGLGQLWRWSEVDAWATTWRRRPGRPPKNES